MKTNIHPSHGEIAACAYFIWLQEGAPHGHDRSHWLQAEKQLIADRFYDGIAPPQPFLMPPGHLAA